MPSAPIHHPFAPLAQRGSDSPRSPAPTPRQLASDELLRDEREVLIRHGDQLYRLRHTRAGKLILTK